MWQKIFQEESKKIYYKNYYNFPISNTLLSNIISKWKSNANRFTKSTVLYNIYDYQNRLILREYRCKYISTKNKTTPDLYEYIIWVNDENIMRKRKSKHYYIDVTFYYPAEFKQLLIFMYKDIITEKKIPGIYILLNGK